MQNSRNIVALVAPLLFLASSTFAGPSETTAVAALGQPDLVSSFPNQPVGVPSAMNLVLSNAADLAIAPSGRIYIADSDNHRILSWPSATGFATGDAADMVFGQPDFTSSNPNSGGLGPASFFLPQGLDVDAAGNLWVCDAFNNRVLRFDDPENDSDPGVADLVIGQFDFNSSLQNLNGDKNSPSAPSLLFPGRVIVDDDDLYIADSGNSRVLHYTLPVTNTPAADRVFGQFGSFATRAENNDGSGNFGCCASAENMFNPIGIAVDDSGSLYVADWQNHRVLRFDDPLTSDTVADAVYGQPDFVSNTPNNGGAMTGLTLPIDLAFDAFSNLYIADAGNHRVLRLENPVADDAPDAVYGQLDNLTTTGINLGMGPFNASADGLFGATGVSIAGSGEVLILDTENMRALRFNAPMLFQPGDMNCDGAITVSDIGGFVLALTDPATYANDFPDCDAMLADVNDDGAVTVSDIGPFVTLLTQS